MNFSDMWFQKFSIQECFWALKAFFWFPFLQRVIIFFASVENCPNLQHFRSLNCRINLNYSPNIYVLLFVKKNQRFHIRLFSQISFAVEPFMPFLVIQKRQSLRTVITLVAIKPYETMRILLMALYTHFLTIYYSASVTTLINSIMHFTEMFISCVSKLESVLDSESVEARTTKLDGLQSEPLC